MGVPFTLVCAEGTPIPLSRSAFESLVKEGRIVGVPTATQSSITEAGEALLDQAREVDLATATFRNRVIHPEHYHDDEQEELPVRAATIPARTKRRCRPLYRKSEMTYGSGYIGL